MSIRLLRRFTNSRPSSSAFHALPPYGGQATTKPCEICGLRFAALISAFLMCVCAAGADTNRFLVLCYHDVPAEAKEDPYAVEVPALVDQLEYMKLHGYSFIGPDDIRRAVKNSTGLPEKSVMLTFDDAYVSFKSNVIKVLELYDCPALLAICGSWIENDPPEDIPAPLMNWEQIREVAAHPLVAVASHSYNLHRAVPLNPQGNTGQAAITRMYIRKEGRYETAQEYRKRIRQDHKQALQLFRERLGVAPDILVWPYGAYNAIAREEAEKLGFKLMFSLGGEAADLNRPEALSRWIIHRNPEPREFVEQLRMHTPPQRQSLQQLRAVQIDLDLIYDESPEQTERNLGRMLDRIVEMRPNAVFLQAFADPDGDGNVTSVYFPNRLLPVRSDLLCRVANQLYVRDFKVFIWMPVLSVDLPGNSDENLRVVEWDGQGGAKPTTYWYRRLSPFSSKSLSIMKTLYGDMAAHARFHGVLFQDDAYLGENEDAHPSAVKAYRRHIKSDPMRPGTWSQSELKTVTEIKTRQLNAFTMELMKEVKRYRSQSAFARNLYAPVSLDPERAEKFAQDFESSLDIYDYVVVMAYPELGGVEHPVPWLEKHVKAVRRHPSALDKTIFKIQSYDWAKDEWIESSELLRRLRRMVAEGARHLAYYPDDYTVDQPMLNVIRREMSSKIKLFRKPPKPDVTKQY